MCRNCNTIKFSFAILFISFGALYKTTIKCKAFSGEKKNEIQTLYLQNLCNNERKKRYYATLCFVICSREYCTNMTKTALCEWKNVPETQVIILIV